jgi:hypothetical protein
LYRSWEFERAAEEFEALRRHDPTIIKRWSSRARPTIVGRPADER